VNASFLERIGFELRNMGVGSSWVGALEISGEASPRAVLPV
jgi:hypothetical protein